ncbi:uncharacterized protein DEA37_0005188 [Paragonimus westermani]|uniref:Uncharacterized protein n=1 Tax=Paragonimus westermani TaxID=34504 RepID=A0A5J4NK88_9TREM|nr:uncharacterized protein DEA37_0005188 [Paragonimus westermani]
MCVRSEIFCREPTFVPYPFRSVLASCPSAGGALIAVRAITMDLDRSMERKINEMQETYMQKMQNELTKLDREFLRKMQVRFAHSLISYHPIVPP